MDILLRDYRQVGLMLLLLLLSALFSGSETALFSLTTADLNRLRRRGGSLYGSVRALHANLGDFLMTVLFCNMSVNILFFATSTVVAADIGRSYGHGPAFLFGIGCLLAVITFGEVTPKTVAVVARVPFCRVTAMPLYGLHRLLAPVRVVLGRFVRVAERLAGVSGPPPRLEAEELQLLVELSREEGVISAREHDFISEVLELHEIRVGEVMTPRVDLATVSIGASPEAVLETARRTGHSKIPVRDPEADEIVAWVDARQVFAEEAPASLEPFVRPAIYVSEFDRLHRVLRLMREKGFRLAVVVDEYGAAAGIVTLTDLVAEIFGEIGDEEADPAQLIRAEGADAYVLDGRVSVREWRGLFGVAAELPRVATVGGLVTALLGRSPRKGDAVTLGNLRMGVRAMRGRRVASLRLTLEGDAAGGPPVPRPAEGEGGG